MNYDEGCSKKADVKKDNKTSSGSYIDPKEITMRMTKPLFPITKEELRESLPQLDAVLEQKWSEAEARSSSQPVNASAPAGLDIDKAISSLLPSDVKLS